MDPKAVGLDDAWMRVARDAGRRVRVVVKEPRWAMRGLRVWVDESCGPPGNLEGIRGVAMDAGMRVDTADIVAVDRNLTVPRRGERRGRLSPGRAISHRK